MRPGRWIVAAALAASLAGAQEAGWREHIRNGEWYFTVGRLAQAEAELRAALDIANRFPPGDRRLERTLEDLGKLYEHEGRSADAQARYQLLLAAVEYRAGKDSPELLEPLAAVGRTALAGGDVPTAREAFERFVAIAQASGKADPDEERGVLATLARMEVLAQDEAAALAHQRRAVELLDAGTPTAGDRIHALVTLAGLELRQGSPPAGEAALERAAKVAEAAGDTGEGIPSPAAIFGGGAEVAAAAGQFEAARRLAERALAAAPTPEERVRALTVLADTAWMRVGRSGGALEDLLGTAAGDPGVIEARQRLEDLAAAQEATGADPGALAATLRRLVLAAAMEGDASAALAAMDRLAVLSAGELPPDLAAAQPALLEAAGRPEEALAATREAIASVEARDGTGSPSLLPLLEREERLLGGLGRRKEARAVRKRLKRLKRTLARRRR